MRLRDFILRATLALLLSPVLGAAAPQDAIIEGWHEEASRAAQEQRRGVALQPIEALPAKRGRGWRNRFRGLSYGVTEEGVKWMDAKGIFTTTSPYGSQMCAVIDDVRYCF